MRRSPDRRRQLFFDPNNERYAGPQQLQEALPNLAGATITDPTGERGEELLQRGLELQQKVAARREEEDQRPPLSLQGPVTPRRLFRWTGNDGLARRNNQREG